jgi:hypothetical protein
MNVFIASTYRLAALILLTATTLSACAIGSRGSYHTFTFNGWFDNWANEVDLLEYDYGGVHSMVSDKVKPEVASLGHQASVNATMPNGEYLYVKWRIKTTGELVADKVDLRNLLPRNMFDHSLTFVIDGRQLIVYLVTPKTKSMDAPPILKTTQSRYYVTYEIYPRNTLPK